MALERKQNIVYVTERCVLRLTERGLTVAEIAPGIDLQRDVLDQVDIPLQISPELVEMDKRLFAPDPMGLTLRSR
jgi:acyl CoA:acetate/3-ketoacid CoA transferase